MGFQENLNSLVQAINNRAKLSDIEPIGDLIANSSSHVPLSGVTSYHLLSGSLALANSVITNGFATTLYTGNGTTQSVVTGVDMATQWGDNASETFGGLVWVKNRNAVNSNMIGDSVRGISKAIFSDLTNAEATSVEYIKSFGSTGFSIGNNAGYNANLATYASWVFQTTHRITGTTNHGKAYTCHYNPYTGFTIVKYEGSGLAGHEIPHHLGRVIDSSIIKRLDVVQDWYVNSLNSSIGLQLNTTSAHTSGALFSSQTITACVLTGTQAAINASGGTYILYGWANSYFDESNTLIGNYEVGIYQGTGAAGNKVTTRGKPAWVMIKRLDSTGNWRIYDNKRTNDGYPLFANLPNAEVTAIDEFDFYADSFVIKGTDVEYNASGGQYLYIVVYDNDSGSGKSKYPRATDTSTLNLNATIPFANGLDVSGAKNSILVKNETVSGLTFTPGKNYIYSKNDGTYGVSAFAPKYGTYNGFGDYFDINKNQWYQSPSVLADDCSTASGWAVTNGTVVSNGSDITVTRSGGTGAVATRTISTVAGQRYRLRSYVYAVTSAAYMYVDTTAVLVVSSGTSGNYYKDFVATGTSFTLTITIDNDGGKAIFDNISIYPINNDGSVDISGATPITESRNYLDAIVYADAGGQPIYVEQLPKTEYKDIVKANEYQGKNACTAWVNFDGTTTPPTIRDSYNVKAVIRTSTGTYEGYYENKVDTNNISITGTANGTCFADSGADAFTNYNTDSKFYIRVLNNSGAPTNQKFINVQIFGGKN